MSSIGSESNPLRVAVIGSGPAGFYTFSNLLKHRQVHVELDMIDRVPTPFGLVRAGVAPDHQKYKTVTRVYDKNAKEPNFRFYGAVEYGTHLHLDDLKSHYHQIVFATGAQTDRELGIAGEHLPGSHAATDFIGWYNGHPDYSQRHFDLSQESVAIIGLGNVAIDIARLLCKTEAELKRTDMADYAIEALAASGVKRVYILGRRGPAQAAFSSPEIKEVGELIDANIQVRREELVLDVLSQKEREEKRDRRVEKNLEILNSFVDRSRHAEKRKTLSIRFLVSPTEIVADESGRVSELQLVKNKAVLNDRGGIGVEATDAIETLRVGLVFRSVGYQGVPLADIPFDDDRSIIPNEKGRVITDRGEVLTGLYCCGWIKRGPTGVIGTNKTDAQQTVGCMMEDLQAGKILNPHQTALNAIEELIRARQPKYVSYRDWQVIDQKELDLGIKATRPRVKFTTVDAMLAELDR